MNDLERELLDRLSESQRRLGIATNALQQFGDQRNWEPVTDHELNYDRQCWRGYVSDPWRMATDALEQIMTSNFNKSER